MSVSCKWNDSKSRTFSVSSGTKQGSILSPDLFSFNIDGIIKRLISSGIGCHVASVFVACILFADDLALLAPTRSSLQKMIDICVEYLRENCLKFNSKKTKVMVFGSGYDDLNNFTNLKIQGNEIEYVYVWKYLGFHIKSDKHCSFCHKNELASFYRSSNSIIRSLKRPNEAVQLHLLYSNCVSILTYGSEVKEYPARDFSTCNTAVNGAIRYIFSFEKVHILSMRILAKLF